MDIPEREEMSNGLSISAACERNFCLAARCLYFMYVCVISHPRPMHMITRMNVNKTSVVSMLLQTDAGEVFSRLPECIIHGWSCKSFDLMSK